MSDIVYATQHEIANAVDISVGTTVQSAARIAQSGVPCTTASPNPPVINADGIPANETYTHTNCKNLAWAPGDTVSGQVNITDTSVGLQNLSYTQTDTNLTVSGSDNGVPFTEVRNGHRFVSSQAGNELSVTRAIQTVRNGSLDISQFWSVQFNPVQGKTVQLFAQLPAGQFSQAAGTVTYSNPQTGFDANIAFYITKPLAFDPGCATPPQFTSGITSFVRSGGSNPGTFTATYSGCGTAPIISSFVPAPNPSPSPSPTVPQVPAPTPSPAPTATPSPGASSTPSSTGVCDPSGVGACPLPVNPGPG